VVSTLGYELIYKLASKLGGLYPTVGLFAIVVLFVLPWVAVAKF